VRATETPVPVAEALTIPRARAVTDGTDVPESDTLAATAATLTDT
jgi:hypothetical protein